jgi:hypothetical protein
MKKKRLTIEEEEAKFLNDPKYRKEIFKALLEHIERGYSLDCFAELDGETIMESLQKYPKEFVRGELVKSQRRAKNMWEDIGARQSNGNCMGNSRAWYYNMVNRYGWHEKSEVKATHDGQVQVSIVNYSPAKPPQ